MTTQTGYLATIAIGTTTAATTTTAFAADTFQALGEVAEIGEFGDERNLVEFISLNDGRVKKSRGSANAGDMPVTYAFDGGDTGQDNLKTAFGVASQALDEYNFRVRFNDAPAASGSPTTFYFRARIMSRRIQSITPDNTITVQSMLAINSAVLEVAAA